MRFNIFMISVIVCMASFGFSCVNSMAGAGNMANVNALLDKAEKQQTPVPKIVEDKNAKETGEIFNSREYQRKLQGQIDALKSKIYPDSKSSNPPAVTRKANHQNAFLMPDERIFLFVSSSMPLSTLKNYAADLDKLKDPNIIMVMQGFVSGVQYIKPTLEFIDSVLIKDPNCDSIREKCDAYEANINIDPALFSKYGVQTVPAIVYARGVTEAGMEKEQGVIGKSASDAYLVSGDVSLDYALEIITKESKSSQTETILKKLRREFY